MPTGTRVDPYRGFNFHVEIDGITQGVWPSKWTGPAFNAASRALAIETLELTPEGVEKA